MQYMIFRVSKFIKGLMMGHILVDLILVINQLNAQILVL